MISAGMGNEVASKIRDEVRANLCGQGWVDAQGSPEGQEFVKNMGVVDDTCGQNFDDAWEANTKGMNDTQQEFFASNVAYYVYTQLDNTCQNNSAFAYMPVSDPEAAATSLFNKSKCFANYVNESALPFSGFIAGLEKDHSLDEFELTLNYHGEKYSFAEMLPHIRLSAVGMHQGTVEGIDMPQSLKDFIDELEKAGLPEHAQLAHDLFYQGVGLTKPSGEMAIAAQPIANQVQDYVRKGAGKPLSDYVMADDADKPGISATNDAKDFPEIEYVFVSKTGPKPDYNVDIKEAPKAIKDYFKDFTPEVRTQVLYLYGQALEKAGKGADEDAVAKMLVDKIKEMGKKHKGDKAKLADELMRLRVDQVEMKGKMPTNIIFKAMDSPFAPYELHERVGTEGSDVKKWIINDIWARVRSKLKDQGVEAMDLKLMGKIVDDLATQLKGKPIKDLAAQEVMAVNKKTGKVSLLQQPKEIQDILFHTANAVNSNIPKTRAEMGGMVYQKIEMIYRAAKKDKPKMKDEDVALKVDEAVDKYLNPYKNEWTSDGVEALRVFLGVKFDGFDKDGNIKLKESVKSTGNPDGSWTATTDNNWNLVYNVGAVLSGGLVLGVDGKDKDPEAAKGNEIFMGYVLGAAKFGFGKPSVGNFTLNLGILAFASPTMMAPGIPEQEQNVSTSLDSGKGQLFRLNHAYPQWDKEWDGEKTDVELAIKAGLIGARPSDGTGLGINMIQNPFGSFQPFTQKSSRSFGFGTDLGLGWGEIDTHYNDESHKAKLTAGVLLGTALAAVQADEKGGMIDAAGFRIGGFLQGDFDASGSTKSTDLQFRLLGVGFQHSSGKYDGVDNALSGYSLLFGGSMMVQPHTNFKAGFGASYGLKQDELDGKIQRFIIGGYLAAPVPIEGKNVTFIPALGLDFFKVSTDERKVGGGTVGGTDPDCDPGYVCEDNGGTTISDDSQGGYASTGDMPMIMAGNGVFEINPNVNVEFGNTGLSVGAGLNIMVIKNVQTKEGDTIFVPHLTISGEW